MRIAHVNTHLIGGAGRAVLRLHDGLGLLGCDSQVYTLSDNLAGFKQVSQFRLPRNILLIVTYMVRRGWIERGHAA